MSFFLREYFIKSYLKIYGERNCGTNYLEQLIKLNYDVELRKYTPGKWETIFLKMIRYDFVQDYFFLKDQKNSLGWKHGIPPFEQLKKADLNSIKIVCICKNPYSFLLSLFHKPYHLKGKRSQNFHDFIRSEWRLRKRDLHSSGSLKNPMDLWNIKIKAYLELQEFFPENTFVIRYEDLLFQPKITLASIQQKFNLLQNDPEFMELNHTGIEEHKENSFYRDYYEKEEWKKAYTKEDILECNNYLDSDLMKKLNYKHLSL